MSEIILIYFFVCRDVRCFTEKTEDRRTRKAKKKFLKIIKCVSVFLTENYIKSKINMS
ncbi:hypothetical protein B4135_3202 [Caldibacillus debilis]|uniref:Uncharacterized protein n=1 Tax=Caldibacillus debilis TaxID=301148 RepID=A0A150LHC9_9BACI|nr:hypothetical protein B4135_3202 [Caldibacillus debilis]